MTAGVATSRFDGVARSATIALLDTVNELTRRGVHVFDLSGGEPDFPTPPHIMDAAIHALRSGFTHYTPSRGIPELRDAIACKLRADNGVVADPESEIVVTPSAKHALFLALTTLLGSGDEIIIPTPSWVSYSSMATLVGARPVLMKLGADSGFQITAEAVEAHVTARTRAILVNTPNNPTGRALNADEVAVVAAAAERHDLMIVTDEVYEKVLFDGHAHLSLAASPGCADRTITVNGFSKSYAMTGWRLGYASGPAPIIRELLKVQEHTVGCAGSFVQRGGLAALTGPQDAVAMMTGEYDARRRLVAGRLDAMPGISCPLPEGAFYAFPAVGDTGFATSAEFADWVLREAGVAVTPGSAFGPGGEGHVRLSFAASADILREALDRMAAALVRRASGSA